MFEKSKQFFNEFNAIFSKKRNEAVSKYTDNTAFTAFIVDEINTIIRKMEYRPQNEYFRIDSSGYTSRYEELEKIKNFNPHLWDLEIAVEHENDSKDWLDEVIKLAHICCPLKVVIGYVPMTERDFEEDTYLTYASEALKRLNCKYNLYQGEFMIILGNSATRKNPKNYFNYKAYVLNSKTLKFDELII